MRKSALTFFAGLALGAMAGILFAPRKGSKTRKKLKSGAGELADTVKETYSNMVGEGKALKEKVKNV